MNSVFGWDYVIQGLFSFAVQLMDTYTPKNSSCNSTHGWINGWINRWINGWINR